MCIYSSHSPPLPAPLSVLWLEEYLQRWKKTLVVVSHDRELLNTVTTDIIHLHDLKLHAYKGNFAQFEEMYDQKRREVNKAFDKYEKQIKAAKMSGKNSKQNAEKVGCMCGVGEGRGGGKSCEEEIVGRGGRKDGHGGILA